MWEPDKIDLAQQLSLTLFGVSMAWAIHTLMQHYPRIHRVGHMWEWPNHFREWVVIVVSWFLLAVVVGGALYSIFFTFDQLRADYNSHAQTDPWLLPALGVIAFYYVYIPFLVNRLVVGAALMLAPGDFREHLYKRDYKRDYLLPRFSRDTLNIWEAHTQCAGFILLLNSGVLIALPLVLTPNVIVTHFDTAVGLFWVAVAVAIFAVIANVPYGCFLKAPRRPPAGPTPSSGS